MAIPADEHARKVRDAIKATLGRPPWFLAISIIYDKPKDGYYIEVHVTEDHPDEVCDLVPNQLDGVPIHIVTKQDQPDNAEAHRVAAFIHEHWPFIPEDDAFEFYLDLGQIAVGEGSVKVSLWVLKRVLEHERI